MNIDSKYMIGFFRDLVNAPSPVGYSDIAFNVMEEYIKELGYKLTYDKKGNGYVEIEGENNEKTVMISSHIDTLGMMVKFINPDGSIAFSPLGGLNYHSVESETITVHTRDGREYNGLVCCRSHSVHVFPDAHTLERKAENMYILLDEVVKTKDDVIAIGIMPGDHISISPRFEYTKSGYVKTRFIDDKGCIACVISMLKTINDLKLKPKYKTKLVFTQYEEVGFGGSYVPEGVSEYLAVDIGLIGPSLNGNEFEVSICTRDAGGPYDRNMTTKLIELAKSNNVKFKTDIFLGYETDACMARRGGNDIVTAAIGPGTHSTHSLERTHIEALENTVKLLVAYVLDK